MSTLTATEARSKLYKLIDETASSHEPIIIKGKTIRALHREQKLSWILRINDIIFFHDDLHNNQVGH